MAFAFAWQKRGFNSVCLQTSSWSPSLHHHSKPHKETITNMNEMIFYNHKVAFKSTSEKIKEPFSHKIISLWSCTSTSVCFCNTFWWLPKWYYMSISCLSLSSVLGGGGVVEAREAEPKAFDIFMFRGREITNSARSRHHLTQIWSFPLDDFLANFQFYGKLDLPPSAEAANYSSKKLVGFGLANWRNGNSFTGAL